ncbi:MAG: phosphoribosylformimino-5-aminoimidazole carboxamide ribotide isomerase [Oscillospiraceae bacterium]|nr:phosphoribosylformimino-5-aminoimidazole carboxamide ribotide isomerase [Oscillospiraceae bacterium]
MKFRPCIDIHNGAVKQIVGGSLRDSGNSAAENFVSDMDAEHYAKMYKERGLAGGHIILLNPAGSEYYEADRQQAFAALAEYPEGLQVGGGVTPENAAEYLNKGASHVIVTSYVFRNGEVDFKRLEEISRETGRERLVLDLSCRKKDGQYFIVTDRWQKWTDTLVTAENIRMLSAYCDEFLIHAADAEGKRQGIEKDIVRLLGDIPEVRAVYAGGIGSFADIECLRELGKGRVDFTAGSALDIFGGDLSFEEVCRIG